MITQAIKDRINAKLRAGIALVEKHYKKTIAMPNVSYALGGARAGTADHGKYTVNINPGLLMENLDDMINNTVPHELAHLVCHIVYPQAYETNIRMARTRRGWQMKRSKRDIHGSYWQEIMRVLGADPARTHNYDTSNTARRKSRYQYKCSRCGELLTTGPKVHKQIQREPMSRWHKPCRGHRLILQGKQAPVKPVVALPKAATAAPKESTKQQRAYALFTANPGVARATMIEMFMRQLAMTQAGASTYYYNCQKVR